MNLEESVKSGHMKAKSSELSAILTHSDFRCENKAPKTIKSLNQSKVEVGNRIPFQDFSCSTGRRSFQAEVSLLTMRWFKFRKQEVLLCSQLSFLILGTGGRDL